MAAKNFSLLSCIQGSHFLIPDISWIPISQIQKLVTSKIAFLKSWIRLDALKQLHTTAEDDISHDHPQTINNTQCMDFLTISTVSHENACYLIVVYSDWTEASIIKVGPVYIVYSYTDWTAINGKLAQSESSQRVERAESPTIDQSCSGTMNTAYHCRVVLMREGGIEGENEGEREARRGRGGRGRGGRGGSRTLSIRMPSVYKCPLCRELHCSKKTLCKENTVHRPNTLYSGIQ